MGKSSTSCFKIITCSDSGSVDPDSLHQSKGPSDKRGWSFRKKSSRHRVLSNTVITETPSSGNKESPGSTDLNFQTTAGASVAEKFVLSLPDEKPHQPISIESNVVEDIVDQESSNKDDCTLEESVVVSIQASIRGFLAQRSLFRLKKLVKLQAAVRGHLVRRHAVGTLRCVHAIIKVQALVRARQTRLSLERSNKEETDDKPNEEDIKSSQSKDRIELTTKPAVTYTSIEKLLSNRFARQLMESAPKNKPMYIKCVSTRQDSSWQWLERWMSVSSADLVEAQRPELITEDKVSENADKSFSHEEAESSSEVFDSANLKYIESDREISVAPVDSEEILTAHGVNDLNFEEGHPTSSDSKDAMELTLLENIDTNKEDHLENDNAQTHAAKSEAESGSISGKYEVDMEQPKPPSLKASEGLESEVKLLRPTSRKSSNPAFIAAQSKFEFGSTPNSGATNVLSSQISGGDSDIDKVSSRKDDDDNGENIELIEDSIPHYTSIKAGGSDCGIELSITSTLDSPDRFEIAPMEFVHEAKVSTEGETPIPVTTENIDVDDNDMHTISVFNLSGPASVEPEKTVSDHGDSNEPVKPENKLEKADSYNEDSYGDARDSFEQVQKTPDSNPSDLQIELEPGMGHVTPYKSSSEVSPRSNMNAPESQETPSSLVSSKATKVEIGSSGSTNKRKSMSSIKRSPSSGNRDSSARDNMDKMSKDTKSGRRRNSFGSVKPDNGEQEQSSSSSSNTLPSYMQATQSARAKANANNSPRSSPDVQDKELYLRKRHSLPSSNAKDGSPRILESLSQTQPGGKGNTLPRAEKKWQR